MLLCTILISKNYGEFKLDMDFLQLDLADPQTRGPIASTINSTNDAFLVDKYVV